MDMPDGTGDNTTLGREMAPFTSQRIVRGQMVERTKLARSKVLRRDMTAAERLLWSRLRANQLDGWHFRRQQVIDGFIADFYCNTAGVLIEADGEVHTTAAAYDIERDRILKMRGLVVLRISNDDILSNLPQTLRRIADVCVAGRRTRHPGVACDDSDLARSHPRPVGRFD